MKNQLKSFAKNSKTLCTLGKGAKIKLIGKVSKYRAKKVSGIWYKVKVTKNGKSYTGYVRINDSGYITKTKLSSSSSKKDTSSSGSSSSDKAQAERDAIMDDIDWSDVDMDGVTQG
jgi:hypothetical protein